MNNERLLDVLARDKGFTGDLYDVGRKHRKRQVASVVALEHKYETPEGVVEEEPAEEPAARPTMFQRYVNSISSWFDTFASYIEHG